MTKALTSEKLGSRATVLPGGLIAVALAAVWVVMASAELVLGPLDALDNVEAMADGSARIATGGLLHLLAAVILTIVVVGVPSLLWRSVLGRIGWWLTLIAVPCLGAFGMLHLLALETAAEGLDGTAMEQFLVQQLGEGGGLWSVPVLITAMVLPFALVLLLVGLARSSSITWIAPALFAVGAIVHLLVPGEVVEVASHGIMAAGTVTAGISMWMRSRSVEN